MSWNIVYFINKDVGPVTYFGDMEAAKSAHQYSSVTYWNMAGALAVL
jgi:hypothetical protein